MEYLSRTFLLFILLAFPTFSVLSPGTSKFVSAEEDAPPGGDAVEGEDEEDAVEDEEEDEEDDEATVEEEDEGDKSDTKLTTEGDEDEEEVDDGSSKASPDADATILFVKPGSTPTTIGAGKLVRFHVGFTNKGGKDFVVESLEASFRYPQDFSFHIQNFTAAVYNRVVEPKRQATFDYAFTPNEAFAGRPFGLVINLNYKDVDGNVWQNAVFNDTITVNEPDEGLDGETFFLYLFLVAMVVLLLVAGQQFLGSLSRKHLGSGSSSSSKGASEPVEMGTQNGIGANGDIDMSWIPSQNLVSLANSGSPKQSPRQRKGGKRRED